MKSTCDEARLGLFEQIYRLVMHVPPGRVVTYGAIARMLGNPRAARTVGWALHGLPAEANVPWHRVVNSQGRISLGGRGRDAERQRHLLAIEGVEFDEWDRIDLERFGWQGLTPLEVDELMETIRQPDPGAL
jgi:methylated-DNA-protein-cysteine methyltransferase-like protein